ncbi:MAG: hypothetical protein K6G91_01970 [Kiritimatiellae bacterium]|nr:hypothetical protein [Kiritimatiellia bacterium]
MRSAVVRAVCLPSVLAALLAGCATGQKYGEFEPKGELAPSNPVEYADYGRAMAHREGYEMAYEWQRADSGRVEEATSPSVLAGFVATPGAADALLAKIGTAYDGDPITLTQIAAVTQLVMCPKCAKAKAARGTWVSALERRRDSSDDGYVKTFCDQQLRLCGYSK